MSTIATAVLTALAVLWLFETALMVLTLKTSGRCDPTLPAKPMQQG